MTQALQSTLIHTLDTVQKALRSPCHIKQIHHIIIQQYPDSAQILFAVIDQTLHFQCQYDIMESPYGRVLQYITELATLDAETVTKPENLCRVIIHHLLKRCKARLSRVRVNSIVMLTNIVKALEYLSEDLYSCMVKEVITRCKDVSSDVRAVSMKFLGYIAEAHESIVSIISNAMKSDSCSKVRLAALSAIPITNESLDEVLDRCSDVNPKVRRLAFRKLTYRIRMRHLSMEKRASILSKGFFDADKFVIQACQVLAESWWKECQKDLTIFVKKLGGLHFEVEVISIIDEMLRLSFVKNDEFNIALDEMKIKDPDFLVCVDRICNHCINVGEGHFISDHMIDTIDFCRLLREVHNETTESKPIQQLWRLQLKLALYLDCHDQTSRESLSTVLSEILVSQSFSTDFAQEMFADIVEIVFSKKLWLVLVDVFQSFEYLQQHDEDISLCELYSKWILITDAVLSNSSGRFKSHIEIMEKLSPYITLENMQQVPLYCDISSTKNMSIYLSFFRSLALREVVYGDHKSSFVTLQLFKEFHKQLSSNIELTKCLIMCIFDILVFFGCFPSSEESFRIYEDLFVQIFTDEVVDHLDTVVTGVSRLVLLRRIWPQGSRKLLVIFSKQLYIHSKNIQLLKGFIQFEYRYEQLNFDRRTFLDAFWCASISSICSNSFSSIFPKMLKTLFMTFSKQQCNDEQMNILQEEFAEDILVAIIAYASLHKESRDQVILELFIELFSCFYTNSLKYAQLVDYIRRHEAIPKRFVVPLCEIGMPVQFNKKPRFDPSNLEHRISDTLEEIRSQVWSRNHTLRLNLSRKRKHLQVSQ